MITSLQKKRIATASIILIILFILANVIYFFYGHPFIRLVYLGEGPSFLNQLLQSKDQYPVEWYYQRGDQFWLKLNLVAGFFILFSSVFYFVKREFFNLLNEIVDRSNLKEFLTSFRVFYEQKKQVTFIIIIIGLIFFIFYGSLGTSFVDTSLFLENDLLFQMDHPRAVGSYSVINDEYPPRTRRHPTYVLFVNPVGSVINSFLDSPVLTAVWLNAFLGGCAVALMFALAYSLTQQVPFSLLSMGIFAISTSQLFFSTIPETGSLAIVGLLILFCIFLYTLSRKRINIAIWFAVGVLTMGVTITNVIPVLICFILCLGYLGHYSIGKRISTTVAYFYLVSISVSLIAVVQKIFYPELPIFFIPSGWGKTFSYASLWVLDQPGLIFGLLFKHFFLVNLVAPKPEVFIMTGRQMPAVSFMEYTGLSLWGWAAMLMWVSILLWAWVKAAFNSHNKVLFQAICLCLLFNMVLHLFFGVGEKGRVEYFIYTYNWTYLQILVLTFLGNIRMRSILVLLSGYLAILIINNLTIFKEILKIYQ